MMNWFSQQLLALLSAWSRIPTDHLYVPPDGALTLGSIPLAEHRRHEATGRAIPIDAAPRAGSPLGSRHRAERVPEGALIVR